MPWCEPCSRYFAPSAMAADGTCPRCARPVESHTVSGRPLRGSDLRRLAAEDGEAPERAPWHFTRLVVLLVAYLGWRIVDIFV